MFSKVLIANRGEIACRVIRTLRHLGAQSVAVYSEADISSRHVSEADESVCVGPAAADQSYLNVDAVLGAAESLGAEAIHPGYGFLSENAAFARACEEGGIRFVGPTPEQLEQFGLKHVARALAEESGVPLLKGTDLLASPDEAISAAQSVGYPVMVKSTAGGGGIGMQVCHHDDDVRAAFAMAQRMGAANFGDAGVFLEKFISAARHVEVQIFGDGKGGLVALGERDCSAQRRNQKVLEETPAPNFTDDVRQQIHAAAVRLGKAVNYRSAGTVEFLVDADTLEFYFLEVNTRLQVEHGVTESVFGVDLVEWMLRLAAGETVPLEVSSPRGHAIEARLYAENPAKEFQPSSGTLTEARFPEDIRIDKWVEAGSEVSPYYDPLLAKLIVQADTREAAVAAMQTALIQTHIAGVETNVPYLRQVVAGEAFSSGRVVTRTLKDLEYQPHAIDVIQPGSLTTVQDYPGRLGYWDVGVPPCGPMDHLSFRLGNRLVGNNEGEAGLEITGSGPTLQFNQPAVITLAGATFDAEIDGTPLATWTPIRIAAGATLRIGRPTDGGLRTFLLIQGGLDVPEYLGSRSTFTLGQFGGHCGRALRAGDELPISAAANSGQPAAPLDAALRPQITSTWEVGVLYGPHGAPDFFTDADIAMLFETSWEVHYNSARTGVRLIGPKPQWARQDGGEAGLHPSNIHDNAYAIGAIDFTGDMPVILGPDGPSLGGFVCPATIVQAELWKMGQLAPGDQVRFVPLSLETAVAAERAQDRMVAELSAAQPEITAVAAPTESPVIARLPEPDVPVEVVYRPAGDKYLLVEYGPLVLDFDLRFRVHELHQWLIEQRLEGVIDLTPGIRSLQVHYDSRVLPQDKLIGLLKDAEQQMPPLDDIEVPTRTIHLPLSWDDTAIHETIDKYTQSVRDDAPWCPSNIEFIRRINGLDSIDEVKRIIFDATYMVLGLGDVYLGAPVASPVDPRHRLVTTKYNPARTWTPPNVVGIGGAYLCIYGMEGPGGYQLFGRTLQVWNTYRETPEFVGDQRWLLRFFDQIRFYPVSHETLMQMRRDFPLGRTQLKIEESTFRMREYHGFLDSIREDTAACKARQQAAFDAERARWEAAGEFEAAERAAAEVTAEVDDVDYSAEGEVVSSPLTASVWKVLVEPDQRVEVDEPLVILEAMKMETSITAPSAGVVKHVLVKPGTLVSSGQALVVIAQE